MEDKRPEEWFEVKYSYVDFLEMRNIDEPCPVCNGFGCRAYANTTQWKGGIGGQMITNGVCDYCWGSGDRYRHGANLNELMNQPKGGK